MVLTSPTTPTIVVGVRLMLTMALPMTRLAREIAAHELLVDEHDRRAVECVARVESRRPSRSRNAQGFEVPARDHFHPGEWPLVGRHWPVRDVESHEAL